MLRYRLLPKYSFEEMQEAIKCLRHLAVNRSMGRPVTYMDVSENSGIPKSSILIGFSIINHPFWGTPIFGNTHILPIHELVDFYGTNDG